MNHPLDVAAPDDTAADSVAPASVFTRRRALKAALLAGGLLAGFTAFKLRPVRFTEYGKLLLPSASEADVMYAFADAILPSGNGWPTIDQTQLIQRADEELFFLEPANSSDFKALLMLIEILPVKAGYLSRFTRMPKQDRLAFLRESAMTDEPLTNVAVNAPRSMLTYLYYGHELTWPKVGYDGPFGNIPQRLGEQRLYYRNLRA